MQVKEKNMLDEELLHLLEDVTGWNKLVVEDMHISCSPDLI